MKKILTTLSIIFALFLQGCSPTEQTSELLQEWYDACDRIESCGSKIDEIKEQELSESDTIKELKILLEDYGSTLDEINNRITILEERVNDLYKLDTRFSNLDGYGEIAELSSLYSLVPAAVISGYQDSENVYIIEISHPNLDSVIEAQGISISHDDLYNMIIQAVINDFSDIYDKDLVIIRVCDYNTNGTEIECLDTTLQDFEVNN